MATIRYTCSPGTGGVIINSHKLAGFTLFRCRCYRYIVKQRCSNNVSLIIFYLPVCCGVVYTRETHLELFIKTGREVQKNRLLTHHDHSGFRVLLYKKKKGRKDSDNAWSQGRPDSRQGVDEWSRISRKKNATTPKMSDIRCEKSMLSRYANNTHTHCHTEEERNNK